METLNSQWEVARCCKSFTSILTNTKIADAASANGWFSLNSKVRLKSKWIGIEKETQLASERVKYQPIKSEHSLYDVI